MAAAQADREVLRVLGGLPLTEARRGVYVVDLTEAGELSPGSRLSPVVRPFVDSGATLLIETAAPPVTLLGGVPASMKIPQGAIRVRDVVVFAEPDVAKEVEERLRTEEQPDSDFLVLAGPQPVGWAGPTPSPDATGRTTIIATPDRLRFTVDLGDADPVAAKQHVEEELASGAPPGSPGKPWSTVFGDPDVTIDGEELTLTVRPLDVPGLFLRALIDQRQATFLP